MRVCKLGVVAIITIMVFFPLAGTAIRVGAAGGGAAEANAWKLIDGIVIDGNLGEWDKSTPIVLDSVSQVYRNPEKWDGKTDISANVYVMWDESNLYVAAEVKDDTRFIYAEGMFLDMNDSMVLYISTNPGASPSRTSYGSTDFRVVLMISELYTDTAFDRDMVADPKGIVTNGMYGGKDVLAGYGRAVGSFPGGYTFEAKIPWSCFSSGQIPLFTPSAGTTIGFNVEMNDLDVPCPGEISAGMAWCGDQGIQTNPSKWGTLTFKVKEIGNMPPVASFDYSPAFPTIENTISFTDKSTDADGVIVSRSWKFGDGAVSGEKNPSHLYENLGAYTVTLTVTDDDGLTGTVSKTVTVSVPGAGAIGGIAILKLENIPPEPFELLSPADGAVVTTATPTLRWEASSDNVSGLDHYEVWIDGVNVENVPSNVTSYTTPDLTEGDHSWYVVAVDCAGNWRRSESTFTFRIAIPALEFAVENLSISPEEVWPGESVTISVDVANIGGVAGSTRIELRINGELIDQETVYLEPGESTRVSFTVAMEEEGSYSVEVDGLTGSFKVVAPPPIWPIAVAVIAACAAMAGALWYLRKR